MYGASFRGVGAPVRELIDRYDLHAGVLPIPIRQVARDEGWLVQYGDIAPAYGYAVVYGQVKVMVINEAIATPFQRFAIAHELAHVLNGDRNHVHLCQPYATRFEDWLRERDERHASLVAARILIPSFAWNADEHPDEIAARCGVPVELVHLRWSDVLR